MSEIYMPRLSDTMEEGVISTWVKQVGDKVSAGDVLVEIETDKAVMEYEAYEDGYLVKQTVSEGDTVPIGAVIGALALNWGKSLFSEAYPDMWPYFMGLMLILVVVLLPRGIVGLADSLRKLAVRRRKHGERAGGNLPVIRESDG